MAITSLWQAASFRGATFFVENFDRAGGRRGPNHEFPNKDEGYPEDTGKKMESHTINAYVATSVSDPEFASRRDALVDALNRRGPGDLVHPGHGSIRVQVREWKEAESRTRLGLTVFELSFVEAGEPTYPTSSKSAASGMSSLGASAHSAAKRVFLRDFTLAGKSDFLMASAQNSCRRVGDVYSLLASLHALPVDFTRILDTLLGLLATLSKEDDGESAADGIAAFPMAVTAWHEKPWETRRNPDGTYRGISALNGHGPLEPGSAASLFRVFEYSGEIDIPRLGATTRQVQWANAEAVAALTRQSAIIEAARVAPFINWRMLQDAETARDRIADALEFEILDTDDDDLFVALSDMRNLVLRTVAPDDGTLPTLMDYTPALTTSSLALAHRLYGGADRAEELAEINGLRHPGFIAGDIPVRILSNA